MLWFTDRSRWEDGHRCPQFRWLKYYSGPKGYGITRAARDLPLLNGGVLHDILAKLLLTKPGQTEEHAVIIKAGIQDYLALCKKWGLVEEDINFSEQAALLEGMAWGWLRLRHRALLEEFEILEVEQEHTVVLDCTCGLGDQAGIKAEHEARDCGGIGLMIRPDFVARRRSDGSVGIHDFKTLATRSKSWDEQWERSVQMAIQSLAVPQATHYYIHGLVKGARKWDKYKECIQQDSVFCYAWHKVGNPPFQEEEWRESWDYTTPDGKGHTLKGQGFSLDPTPWTDMRRWVQQLSSEKLASFYCTLGPFPRPQFLIGSVLLDLVQQERGWQGLAYDASQGDVYIPKYWTCYTYGKPCPYMPLCWQEVPGFSEPLSLTYADGKPMFVERDPHHSTEVEE